MKYSDSYDFKYSGFTVSRYNIEDYIAALPGNGGLFGRRTMYYHSYGIVESMIRSIASNDFAFNPNDRGMCRLLEEMIRKGGHDRGVYSESAHMAMRNLCIAQGKNPDNHLLYDKTISGRISQATSKIKGLFGFGKKKHGAAPAEFEPAQVVDAPAESTPVSHIDTDVDVAVEPAPVQQQTVPDTVIEPGVDVPVTDAVADTQPQKSSRKANILYNMAATVAGIAAIGALVLTGGRVNNMNGDAAPVDSVPTFKTVSMGDTSRTMTQVYNLGDFANQARNATIPTLTAPRMLNTARAPRTPMMPTVASVRPATHVAPVVTPAVPAKKVTKQAPTASRVATDSVAVQLTRASKSSLNILLGTKKADELCRRVQSQIDAGIFAAPNGMSAERIAHAMTMSRVYEGKSVILDALNSKVALTPAQQAAFNQHIDEIGDMGVKIQKRMASKHKLSKHSCFDRASHAQQTVHIKNVKQLKQFRKLARTR